jgi:thiol-disulfide isomerase/thioredoxin
MKILKIINCVIILGVLFTACNRFKGYTVDGKITGGLNPSIKKVYLEQLGTTKTTIIDTGVIASDGSFKLKGFVKDEGLYRIRFSPDKFIYLVMQNVAINVGINLDSLQYYTISGSPVSSELKGFLDTLTHRNQRMMALQKAITQSKSKDSSLEKQSQEAFQNMMMISSGTQTFVNKFVDTVKDPVVAIFAVNTLNFSENFKKFEVLANRLLKQYPDNTFVKDYAGLISQMDQQIAATKASSFKPGDEVPDITLPNPDGKIISLSSLRGKYVLLDFWASWCQPCRHENPNIVKAYDKYKDKGFTIYSVSLDDNKAHWLTAISYDKLSWPNHVSELKGWDSKVVTQYHFNGIPHNLLLDTQGKVVAVDLRGDALDNALASLIQ